MPSSRPSLGARLREWFDAIQMNLSGYYPVNVGFTHDFHLPENCGRIPVRFDVTNVFDQSYQLRNGTGIGVLAPQ